MNARRQMALFPRLLLLALLAGCGRKGEEVVVYVAVDRSRAEPILNSFEQETNIQVRAIYDAEAAKTTGLVTRLLTESARPRCDVFWNNELAQSCLLAQAKVLAEYRSPVAQDIPANFRSPAGLWSGMATRARVIVYNTKLVSAGEAPRSIFELALPKWRGKVAIANPQFGTTRAHVAALFAVLGPDKAREFLEKLLANDVQIVDGNAMVKNLVARNAGSSAGVLVGLTDTDDVCEGRNAGEPVAMVLPDQDTIGTFLCPCTVALIRNAPHCATAKRLVDYLVSAKVEGRISHATSGYMQVRRPQEVAGTPNARRWFEIDERQLLDQLESSSRWTLEHFHR